MNKLKLVALVSICLVVISLVIFGNISNISDSSRYNILQEYGGSMSTDLLDRKMDSVEEFYKSIACISAVMGIGGLYMVTDKWIEKS